MFAAVASAASALVCFVFCGVGNKGGGDNGAAARHTYIEKNI